jgi:hypothetical protein
MLRLRTMARCTAQAAASHRVSVRTHKKRAATKRGHEHAPYRTAKRLAKGTHPAHPVITHKGSKHQPAKPVRRVHRHVPKVRPTPTPTR